MKKKHHPEFDVAITFKFPAINFPNAKPRKPKPDPDIELWQKWIRDNSTLQKQPKKK